jgi:ankyrin repeat protein
MDTNLFGGNLQGTALHLAAADGDVEQVRRLLAEGAEIEARDFHDQTPLMTACNTHMVELRSLTQSLGQAAPQVPDRLPDLKQMPRLDPKRIFAELKARSQQPPDDTLPPDDPSVALALLEHGAQVNAADRHGYTPLMQAVMSKRVATARALLEHGADLRAQNKDHHTPLMLAARSRCLEAVQLLLEWGADPDYRTPIGYTSLMAAADGGRVEVAQLLLEHGQAVETVSANGTTALLRAALGGHEKMIAFLREAGAQVDFLVAAVIGDIDMARQLSAPPVEERHRTWGYSALFRAIKNERIEIVRLLLEVGVDANAVNSAGQSALMSAVMRGDLECTRLLLDAGADPEGAPGAHFTPLQWAGKYGHKEIVELLLARKAGVEAGNWETGGALSGAVMGDNLETARKLLEAGANPNGKGPGGLPLLHFAVMNNNLEMIRLLLEHGASPRAVGAEAMAKTLGRPEIAAMLKQAQPVDLHELASEGKTELLLEHLDAGADINALGNRIGETLLLAALRGKQPELVRLLIERGADIHLSGDLGQTPLIYAAMLNDVDSVRLLLERGADVAYVNEEGMSAMTYAAISGNVEIVALLTEAGGRVGPTEAAMLGDLDTLRQRLNAGEEVDAGATGGITPLMGAARAGNLEMVEALLIRGADLNALDRHRRTPLVWAVTYKQFEAARLLLDRGAEVDRGGAWQPLNPRMQARLTRKFEELGLKKERALIAELEPQRSWAPLTLAALLDDIPLVELLLERGAEIDAISHPGGESALAHAALTGKVETVRCLLAHGANPELKDRFGHTALTTLKQLGKHPEIVALLEAHSLKS